MFPYGAPMPNAPDATALERTDRAPVTAKDHATALGLAALLGTAGTMHFVNPAFFDAIVPSWMPGKARTTTYVSGVVELAAAALVAVPRTRRIGGWFAAATFVGVFPANVWAALDGGMQDLDPPFDSPLVAWLRLPLQFPLIAWAVRVARRAPG